MGQNYKFWDSIKMPNLGSDRLIDESFRIRFRMSRTSLESRIHVRPVEWIQLQSRRSIALQPRQGYSTPSSPVLLPRCLRAQQSNSADTTRANARQQPLRVSAGIGQWLIEITRSATSSADGCCFWQSQCMWQPCR